MDQQGYRIALWAVPGDMLLCESEGVPLENRLDKLHLLWYPEKVCQTNC